MNISVNTAVKTTLVGLLHVYRLVISPLFPPCCRYYPSCSAYAVQAIRLHGPILGGWLALKRLGSCHPWAPGGHDPVPARASGSPAKSLSAAASAPQAVPSASDFFLRGVPPRAPRLKAPARLRSSTMEQPALVAGAPRGRLLHGRERLS